MKGNKKATDGKEEKKMDEKICLIKLQNNEITKEMVAYYTTEVEENYRDGKIKSIVESIEKQETMEEIKVAFYIKLMIRLEKEIVKFTERDTEFIKETNKKMIKWMQEKLIEKNKIFLLFVNIDEISFVLYQLFAAQDLWSGREDYVDEDKVIEDINNVSVQSSLINNYNEFEEKYGDQKKIKKEHVLWLYANKNKNELKQKENYWEDEKLKNFLAELIVFLMSDKNIEIDDEVKEIKGMKEVLIKELEEKKYHLAANLLEKRQTITKREKKKALEKQLKIIHEFVEGANGFFVLKDEKIELEKDEYILVESQNKISIKRIMEKKEKTFCYVEDVLNGFLKNAVDKEENIKIDIEEKYIISLRKLIAGYNMELETKENKKIVKKLWDCVIYSELRNKKRTANFVNKKRIIPVYKTFFGGENEREKFEDFLEKVSEVYAVKFDGKDLGKIVGQMTDQMISWAVEKYHKEVYNEAIKCQGKEMAIMKDYLEWSAK